MSVMGNRIRQKRIENNMSMEELGKKLGVHRAAIGKWENGDVDNIKRTSIEKMSRLFGVSPSWLMGFDDPTNVSLTYAAPGAETVKVKADHSPIIGKTSDRARLYEAAANVAEENIAVALKVLLSLAPRSDVVDGFKNTLPNGTEVFIEKDRKG